MVRTFGVWLLFLSASISSTATALGNDTSPHLDLLRAQHIWSLNNRPDDCPPCFNCQLPDFKCKQFSPCNNRNGRCECPPGFAGDDCLNPLCGSLGGGDHRPLKGEEPCQCDEGWEGINCNVCKTNDACNALMPETSDGVCYKQGITVKRNFQQCDVTNRKILEMLKRKPQVTFSCEEAKNEQEDSQCTFQFWVDHQESFYCQLKECGWELQTSHDANITDYNCNKVECECIPGRTMCGENGTLDLTEFLAESITGPAKFSCDSSKSIDSCFFSEKNMNGVIMAIFGDETILLDCDSGECLHKSEVPGYSRPVKTINKPLIAGAIAASALFIVVVVLTLWYLSRRASQNRGLGPIHLPRDDDDEALKMLAEHKPAALHFRDVSYELNGKQILQGVQGGVNPGQVMAIMGPSGAGKTTFLDLIARKNKRGQINGEFYVNGSKISDDDFKEIVGFVDQEDTMMATLTVHETILNSALLRLPSDMSFQSKNRRVIEVMHQLGIFGIRDQIIGTSEDNGVRGISGGEKRRVSIACELVTSPSILFLDEPTSGLDSYNAYNVVECLVNLARNYRRTIVFTIHQPKSNIVALFDQLVLLAKGRCVYSGPFDKCQHYFDSQGFPCPPGFNIADYLVDLTVHAEQRRAFPQDDLIQPDEASVPSRNRQSSEHRSSSIGGSQSNKPSSRPLLQDHEPSASEIQTEVFSRPSLRNRGSSIGERQSNKLFSKKSTARSETSGVSEDGVPLSDQRRSIDEAETDELLPPSARHDTTELDELIDSYRKSDLAREVREEVNSASASTATPDGTGNGDASGVTDLKGFKRLGWLGQFSILSNRTWKNLYRNPMLMLAHYAVSIVLAVLCGYLFFGLKDDISGFQNRMGLFFFILALFGFSTLTSLNVFANERTLFLRERANGYYAPVTYFTAKVMFDIVPLRIIPPIIMGSILYPMAGLVSEWPEFFKFLLVLVLFNLAASAICLFIGIICKDTSLANLIGSLVMLFSLLLAGLLLNHNSIPPGAVWLQKLSIFHYGFEALIVNEVRYLTLTEHKFGLDIEVPGATILSTFGFHSWAYWEDVTGLAVFAITFIVLSYSAMHVMLVEKR